MYLWEPEVYGITPLTEDTARTFKHTRREAVGPCTRRGPLDRLEEVVVEVGDGIAEPGERHARAWPERPREPTFAIFASSTCESPRASRARLRRAPTPS